MHLKSSELIKSQRFLKSNQREKNVDINHFTSHYKRVRLRHLKNVFCFIPMSFVKWSDAFGGYNRFNCN